jgi:hypothetical protein
VPQYVCVCVGLCMYMCLHALICRVYGNAFNVHGSVYHKNIPIHIQQDAMLNSLLYLEIALHVSGGTPTHHQEGIQLYLQHLVFITSLLLFAAIVEKFHNSSR